MNISYNDTEENSNACPSFQYGNKTLWLTDCIIQSIRTQKIHDEYGEHFNTNFIATCTICILGYITNVLNVMVLSKTPLDNSMNLFLMVLSVSDLFHITTQFSHVVHFFGGFKMYPFYKWVVFYVTNTYFENSFVFVSNWLVAVIGIWRLMVIAWPLESRRLCSRFRAKLTMVLIFVFSFGLSSMIFAQFTYESIDFQGVTLYETTFTSFARANDDLFLKIQWGMQLLKNLIPMIVLLVATFGLIGVLIWTRYQRQKVLKMQSSSATNHRITVMLLVLLILYLMSNLPDAFMFLIHIASGQDILLLNSYRENTDIVRIFSLANSSVSFFIYFALGQDFRRRFNKIFSSHVLKRFGKFPTSEGVSESSTVRSKSFDVGSSKKGFSMQMQTLPK